MAKRHASALKRNRQNQKQREGNRAVRSRVRTEVRKAREAIGQEDVTSAETELPGAIRELTKAGTKGVMHRNAVSRRVSRLSKQVAGLKKQAS